MDKDTKNLLLTLFGIVALVAVFIFLKNKFSLFGGGKGDASGGKGSKGVDSWSGLF